MRVVAVRRVAERCEAERSVESRCAAARRGAERREASRRIARENSQRPQRIAQTAVQPVILCDLGERFPVAIILGVQYTPDCLELLSPFRRRCGEIDGNANAAPPLLLAFAAATVCSFAESLLY